MNEQSFEQLADQAAAGLKSDRELYLDVKQELCTHLEEKAEYFVQEGHSPEESVELSRKSLGSPMDLAAGLLDGNRRRMRFRSLLRLGFGALIVPAAIVLAVFVGYGRFARLSQAASSIAGSMGIISDLPAVPSLGSHVGSPERTQVTRQLASGEDHAQDIRRYWESHRQDPDSHMYYAYYAISLRPGDEHSYVTAMRLGERIEPQNALYNVLLAEYYLRRAVTEPTGKLIMVSPPPALPPPAPVAYAGVPAAPRADKVAKLVMTGTSRLLDRRLFELGVTELRGAVKKPFLRSYQMRILRMKINAEPAPRLTEDYVQLIEISAGECFPHLARYRRLARMAGGSARILISEGRPADAEAVMDTWKPLTRLLLSETRTTLIQVLVVRSAASIMTKEAGQIYEKLGAHTKAREATIMNDRLARLLDELRPHNRGMDQERMVGERGSRLQGMLFPVFGAGTELTEQDLTPGRMHEHVVVEEMFVQALLVILMFLLLGTLLQGTIWLFRLRSAESVPLLLMPPSTELLRALLLGILAPVAVYWIYSRLPGIGGREFSWESGMQTRFITELLVLGLLMLWIPARIIRRYVRRRCADLDIAVPGAKDETAVGWKLRLAFVVGALFVAFYYGIETNASPFALVCIFALALTIMTAAARYARAKRRQFGLYYGTLARSLAPVYAFSIIFIAVALQPLQLSDEARWLRKDTILYGYLASRSNNVLGFSSIEQRVSQTWSDKMLRAITGNREHGRE